MKKSLTNEDLKFLSEKIAEAETRTCGEIRVVVRHRRHWKERLLSVHDLALREFYRLGMEKTAQRTGILIILLLSERAFHIVADEGIQSKVEEGTWDSIASAMSGHFVKGNFRDGLSHAIERVGGVLATHFPGTPDQADQLPNDVIEE